MEQLIQFLRKENDIIDSEVHDSQLRWHSFWTGFASHTSVMKIDGCPLMAPVMTAEKRLEMQMLKNQACVTEVRMKQRKREKDILTRVQQSLEEMKRERNECEGNVQMELPSYSSQQQSSQSSSSSAKSTPQKNNNAHSKSDGEVPSNHTIHNKSGESQHTTPGQLQSHSIRVRYGSDSTQASDGEELKNLILVTAPKIHRRRRGSGGSTNSDTAVLHRENSKPRHRSSSNTSTASEPIRHDDAANIKSSQSKVTVRRTASDRGFRRSGSERTLDRLNDDEKPLKRTGSGDIPTVIRSDSNPMIATHRRVGSGDMSSLHSQKQTAINYLTRSYDMSIRSLMTEELNSPKPLHEILLKVNDTLTSDCEVTPSTYNPLLDSKVLSAKYLSSSPHSKEPGKLVPRTGHQKKTSPTKETGPPQPVKAIHSLPPSLAPSREGTFESLLPKGPLFPDVDSKECPSSPLAKDGKPKTADSLGEPSSGSQSEAEVDDVKQSSSTEGPLLESTDPIAIPQAKIPTGDSGEKLPLSESIYVLPVTSARCSIDSPGGFMSLPNKLLPTGDHSTQQWLVDKISQLHSSGEVDIHDWLQNAPDSVKQKLPHLYQSTGKAPASSKEQTLKEQEMMIDLTHSLDDTLRSTSPIPVNEQVVISTTIAKESSDSSPVKTSSFSAERPSLILRSNSYTLDKPSVALLIAERANRKASETSSKQLSSQASQPNVPSPARSEKAPSTHNRVNSKQGESTTPKPQDSSLPSAIERSRAVASKSYIVEHPSAALLDSLNESQRSLAESAAKSSSPSSGEKESSTCGSRHASLSETSTNVTGTTDENSKKSVQRKLEYFSLDRLRQPNSQSASTKPQSSPESDSYHSVKYESPDKRAHIKKYLQQFGVTAQEQKTKNDIPEAWAENSKQSSVTQSTNENKIKDKKDLFNQVRKELTLLKTKYSEKMSPSRPSSAEPTATVTVSSPKRDTRPTTALPFSMPFSQYRRNQNTSSANSTVASSIDQNLSLLRDRLQSAIKQPVFSPPGHVKSYAEKEATPIATGYSIDVDESFSEYSTFGGIHSVSHPKVPATHLSIAQSHVITDNFTTRGSFRRTSIDHSDRIAAVVKGHLCRRLLNTAKVQLIVKTIRDCQNLLVDSPLNSKGGNTQKPMSLQDLNFQERLLDQWQAGLQDIHEIFFELPIEKRMALIKQSEIEESQPKNQLKKTKTRVARTTSNKEQQPPKRKITTVTSKVMDRKKAQKAAVDSVSKGQTMTSLKKAVLAPQFAANSPQKANSTLSGRVSKNYLRRSPVRKSLDSLRKKV